MVVKIVTRSSNETKKLGQQIGCGLSGGEIFFLTGQLGAGKTCFVKGIAKGLDVRETITSPTFTLIQKLNIKRKKSQVKYLIHIDLYRLKKHDEIIQLGLEEFFTPQHIVCIEWAEKLKGIFPDIQATSVEFTYNKENEREITIKNLPEYVEDRLFKSLQPIRKN